MAAETVQEKTFDALPATERSWTPLHRDPGGSHAVRQPTKQPPPRPYSERVVLEKENDS
jgi:hypothetical protein